MHWCRLSPDDGLARALCQHSATRPQNLGVIRLATEFDLEHLGTVTFVGHVVLREHHGGCHGNENGTLLIEEQLTHGTVGGELLHDFVRFVQVRHVS